MICLEDRECANAKFANVRMTNVRVSNLPVGRKLFELSMIKKHKKKQMEGGESANLLKLTTCRTTKDKL